MHLRGKRRGAAREQYRQSIRFPRHRLPYRLSMHALLLPVLLLSDLPYPSRAAITRAGWRGRTAQPMTGVQMLGLAGGMQC